MSFLKKTWDRLTGRRVEVYRDKRGEWRWHVVARNGRYLSDSGQGYNRRKDCLAKAVSLFPHLPVEYYDLRTSTWVKVQ